MDILVPTVESMILVLEECMGPINEDPFPGESMAPEAEVDISSASPEMTAHVATVDEPSAPVTG